MAITKGGRSKKSWLDVTLATRNNPSLAEAIQSVPVNSKLAPELKLVSPKIQKAPPGPEEDVVREEFEPPGQELPLLGLRRLGASGSAPGAGYG